MSDLKTIFDQCATELAASIGIETGYLMEDSSRTYHHYMSNAKWQSILDEFRSKYKMAFKEFGGDKGKEIHSGKFPPKMASFGSSSFMMYELARDIQGFHFEHIIPTKVGNSANLDGYYAEGKESIFVEAKKHEIYDAHSHDASVYDDVYIYLKENSCLSDYDKTFMINDKEILYFDFKQIVCHFLAIAYDAIMNPDQYISKPIHFIYLIYNPSSLEAAKSYTSDLKKHYDGVVGSNGECASIDFCRLFKVIFDYQLINSHKTSSKKYTSIVKGFRFDMADQNDFVSYLN